MAAEGSHTTSKLRPIQWVAVGATALAIGAWLAGGVFAACALFVVAFVAGLISLRRPPRALSVSTSILGCLGLIVTLPAVALLLAIGWASEHDDPLLRRLGALGLAMTGELDKYVALEKAQEAVESMRSGPGGILPLDGEGQAAISHLRDPRDRPLRYRRTADGYEIRSCGLDAKLDTADDEIVTGK